MDTSIVLAQIIGVTMAVMGFGIVVNTKYNHKVFSDMLKNDALIFITQIMTFVLGMAIVIYHNVWDGTWTILVTIFGWIALIKGVLLALLPKQLIKISYPFVKSESMVMMVGVVIFVLGLIYGYFGFFA